MRGARHCLPIVVCFLLSLSGAEAQKTKDCAVRCPENSECVDSKSCRCKAGFSKVELNAKLIACEDLNECVQNVPPSCGMFAMCQNSVGSYYCICNPGYKLLSGAESFTNKSENTCQELLLQDWSADFENKMRELRATIVHINSTRVDLSLANGLTSWIQTAMDHLKEWAGVGFLAILMILASLVCLWYIYNKRATQKRNAAMIIQALVATEAGQSPQTWLTAMKP